MNQFTPDESVAEPRSIYQDRSFYGLLLTQFLGAFNDNFYKQLVMLVCVGMATKDRSENLQGIATVLFSAPFVLISGFCGFLADRYSKRRIVVLSKVLEIVVMGLGLMAFQFGSVQGMLAVLFCMGAQSAFFGPSKYGILPELFREDDLPQVNGAVLMTTFLSIILGFVAAGMVLDSIDGQIWIASLFSIGIAVLGTLTSLMIRRTPVARPGLAFHPWALIGSKETLQLIFRNRKLLLALLATSLFWTCGGVVYPPAVNDLGKIQFGLSASSTSQLAASTGLGIAVGCVLAGLLSQHRFRGLLVRLGALGMLLSMVLLGLPGEYRGTLLGVWGSAAMLITLGGVAGLFSVPLQVYLQARAPAEHKGRVIGTMNLANWIGICFSGGYYHLLNKVFAASHIRPNAMFLAAAALMLPLVLLYRPRSESLGTSIEDSPAAERS